MKPGAKAGANVPTPQVMRTPMVATGRALGKLRDEKLELRGAKDAGLFRTIAPSVVLIVSKDGIGSGSLLNASGDIITNWHVIEGNEKVGVIFRPADPMAPVGKADIVSADVVRYDEVADLALIRVAKVPAGIKPIRIADIQQSGIDVGSDVHAIGHPTGETWTYTKGLVSQIRPGYEWRSDDERKHQADVIQTQTPINPGNSGGPLIADDGAMVGVNSFGRSQMQGLNFAVAATEVKRFLAATQNRKAETTAAKPDTANSGAECKIKKLREGQSEKAKGFVRVFDSDCNGSGDAILIIPDDPLEAVMLRLDTNEDGKTDVVVYDENRDEKWDYSLADTDFDGKPDTIGQHPDGSVDPTTVERYDPDAPKKG